MYLNTLASDSSCSAIRLTVTLDVFKYSKKN